MACDGRLLSSIALVQGWSFRSGELQGLGRPKEIAYLLLSQGLGVGTIDTDQEVVTSDAVCGHLSAGIDMQDMGRLAGSHEAKGTA